MIQSDIIIKPNLPPKLFFPLTDEVTCWFVSPFIVRHLSPTPTHPLFLSFSVFWEIHFSTCEVRSGQGQIIIRSKHLRDDTLHTHTPPPPLPTSTCVAQDDVFLISIFSSTKIPKGSFESSGLKIWTQTWVNAWNVLVGKTREQWDSRAFYWKNKNKI